MVLETCQIFDSAKLRNTILEVKKRNEIIIDAISIDELLEAGFDEQAQKQSMKTIESFKEFIEENKDELTALQIIYSKSMKMREITFKDIKELARSIENPPYNLTPEQLWAAYKKLDKSKVKDNPVKTLTDLISIVRFSTGNQDMLVPFTELVDEKFVILFLIVSTLFSLLALISKLLLPSINLSVGVTPSPIHLAPSHLYVMDPAVKVSFVLGLVGKLIAI